MHIVRLFLSAPAAAFVTLGLFAFMAAMIANDRIDIAPVRALPDIDIFAKPPQPETMPEQRRPSPLPEKPPVIDRNPLPQPGKPGPVYDAPDYVPGDATPGNMGGVFPAPVIKHAPAYPETCRGRGAQGTVIVQFDVTPEGTVVNPQIISSAHGCFNRTVIRTVSKWKYPPLMENGRARTRRGVIETFVFTLED